MAATSTSLKRTGTSAYSAIVVAKASPANWGEETLLLRFMEQTGKNTVFVISGAALNDFKSCDVGCTYDMQIPGKCLRQRDSKKKYGVDNAYEVALRFSCTVSSSTASWPLLFPYSFADWTDLEKMQDDVFFDLCGKVADAPKKNTTTSLSKLLVPLSNGSFCEMVEFIGEQACLTVSAGDTLVLGGVRLTRWREQRKIQTSFLTIVEVNPERDDLPDFDSAGEDEGPKKKALKMVCPITITIAEALTSKANRLVDAQTGHEQTIWDFSLRGTISPFTEEFFNADAPLVDTAKGEVMCLQSQVCDDTGSMSVKFWDRACHELFGITASDLRKLWEEGVESEGKRPEILTILNKNTTKKFLCLCAGVTREYGAPLKKYSIQINVSNLEFEIVA